MCEHNFQYQGVVWSLTTYSLPGSGARGMIYEDRYYCTKCLEVVDRKPREYGNSYSNPMQGSVPK